MTTIRSEAIKHFNHMRDMAELKALSDYSIEHPLTQKQYDRLMELKKLLTETGED